MTLEEAKLEFPIGTKVIPIRKSLGCHLEKCDHYIKYKNKHLNYLYVADVKMVSFEPALVLRSDNTGSVCGNHYAVDDVRKYKEKSTRYLFE